MAYLPPSSVGEPSLLSLKSPVLAMFQDISEKLMDRYDRHERIYRLSRDITIESKRIIFLLHSPPVIEKPQSKIIAEAKARLKKLINGPIKAIALEEAPNYLHLKAYSAGMQEFVEAQTFCSYMEHREVMPWQEIQNELSYTIQCQDGTHKTIHTLLTEEDYLLGIADLTGEVMRKTIFEAINRDGEAIVFACGLLRQYYLGFTNLDYIKGMPFKIKTLRSSLLKVERTLMSHNLRALEAITILRQRDQQALLDIEREQDTFHTDHFDY